MTSLKKVRRYAASCCIVTMMSEVIIHVFSLSQIMINILSITAIVFAIAAVYIVVRFHRCPRCHAFIQITARPEECLHCGCSLRN